MWSFSFSRKLGHSRTQKGVEAVVCSRASICEIHAALGRFGVKAQKKSEPLSPIPIRAMLHRHGRVFELLLVALAAALSPLGVRIGERSHL